MAPEAYSEQSGTSKMELLRKQWTAEIVDGSKSFILDVLLRSEYASGTVNYCHQKLHLKSLIGLWICLCLYWVCQFLNKTSKTCYEETQKNGKKHVLFVPRNSCSKLFVNFWLRVANYQLGSLWYDSNLYKHLYL